MPKEMNLLLKSLEEFRVRLIRETGYLSEDVSYVAETSFRNKQSKPLQINGFPVFRFSYPGTLPLYDSHDKEFQAVIRRMYLEATFNLYDFNAIETRFDKATIIIEHHFKEAGIRDLDNRNRKYLIDAVRATGLIPDDNAHVLTLLEEAHLTDTEPYIDVFVLERENLFPFLTWRGANNREIHDGKIFSEVNINAVEKMMAGEEIDVLVSDGANDFWN
ncbi:hypothetical protein [Neobacillus sp. 19]|uniref:hypothetical protein n=1 Tax=Neobacillus sp. 19 TaxID=3394458 RepID=UPI0005AB0D25